MNNLEKCIAIVEVADDEGYNHATFTCELHNGHNGDHRETVVKSGGLLTVIFDDNSSDHK